MLEIKSEWLPYVNNEAEECNKILVLYAKTDDVWSHTTVVHSDKDEEFIDNIAMGLKCLLINCYRKENK